MADQKVSDLPSLNGADVDAADLLYIIDSSAGSAGSKKITVGQYQLAPVSGGTANGVMYLDGSKVATAGSDLVFDGTNFSTTGTASATKLIPTGGSATGNGMFLPAANTLGFSTNGTQAMTLDASGNLSCIRAFTSGNSTFAGSLNAQGGGSGATIAITPDTISGSNGVVYNTSFVTGGVGPHIFQTGGTERARITSGGDLLVGTTSALVGSSRRGISVLAPTGTYVAGSFANDAGSAAQTIEAWNKATTGNNSFVSFATEGTLTERGQITYNRAGGLVAYNTTSDYRAKDIIGPVQNHGATIDALKVYEGVMKGATQSRPMLVAHEAQAVAPYCVTGEKDAVNEDGTPIFQQMDVSALVPLLLAEIQSLRARVAALESA